jgi:hypothetical protein
MAETGEIAIMLEREREEGSPNKDVGLVLDLKLWDQL